MRQRQHVVVTDDRLPVGVGRTDHVDVESSWAPTDVSGPVSSALEFEATLQPVTRRDRGVDDERDVVEVGLFDTAPRGRRIDARRRDEVVGECVDDLTEPGLSVAEIGTGGQHGARHLEPPADLRERRVTTATSAKSSGIGADGLCTTTSHA